VQYLFKTDLLFKVEPFAAFCACVWFDVTVNVDVACNLGSYLGCK